MFFDFDCDFGIFFSFVFFLKKFIGFQLARSMIRIESEWRCLQISFSFFFVCQRRRSLSNCFFFFRFFFFLQFAGRHRLDGVSAEWRRDVFFSLKKKKRKEKIEEKKLHSTLPGFYRVLPGFTGFYQVLPGFVGFYQVLLEFYLILT